jgi:hypothetical protein
MKKITQEWLNAANDDLKVIDEFELDFVNKSNTLI